MKTKASTKKKPTSVATRRTSASRTTMKSAAGRYSSKGSAVDWESRAKGPIVTDRKGAHKVIDRATSRIDENAQVDTISGL